MKLFGLITKNSVNIEPLPDIAKCSNCGWSGPVNECIEGEDGDWENGYYSIHECPKCDDGGCIDDYEMSIDQAKKWNKWYEKRENTKIYNYV